MASLYYLHCSQSLAESIPGEACPWWENCGGFESVATGGHQSTTSVERRFEQCTVVVATDRNGET